MMLDTLKGLFYQIRAGFRFLEDWTAKTVGPVDMNVDRMKC